MSQKLLSRAASFEDLKRLAERRIPRFSYEYLAGGCNGESALGRNRRALDETLLSPQYLKTSDKANTKTTLFGQEYGAPFGVAPLGLSGLIWPHSSKFHASAALASNIPYVLSTLSSTSIEDAAACAGENFWFQLYPPSDLEVRSDLMRRAWDAGCRNLVITIDVPAAGRRPKDIKNGLAVPPKISINSVIQTMMRPQWAMATGLHGMPKFASMMPYMKDISNLQDVANYIRTTLKDVVDQKMLASIRGQWKGNLIVKGIINVADAERAIEAGADGLIVSNHGGRQLDAAQSSIAALSEIAAAVGDRATIMVDSGVESGIDIARFVAHGAQMVFAGRAFMYGVAAFGKKGAQHTIDIFNAELVQVMEQLRCEEVGKLPEFAINLR